MSPPQVLLLEPDPVLRGLLEELCREEGLEVKSCTTWTDLRATVTGMPGQVALIDEHLVDDQFADALQTHFDRLSPRVAVVVLGLSASRHVPLDGPYVTVVPMPFDVYELLGAIHAAGEMSIDVYARQVPVEGASRLGTRRDRGAQHSI